MSENLARGESIIPNGTFCDFVRKRRIKGYVPRLVPRNPGHSGRGRLGTTGGCIFTWQVPQQARGASAMPPMLGPSGVGDTGLAPCQVHRRQRIRTKIQGAPREVCHVFCPSRFPSLSKLQSPCPTWHKPSSRLDCGRTREIRPKSLTFFFSVLHARLFLALSHPSLRPTPAPTAIRAPAFRTPFCLRWSSILLLPQTSLDVGLKTRISDSFNSNRFDREGKQILSPRLSKRF